VLVKRTKISSKTDISKQVTITQTQVYKTEWSKESKRPAKQTYLSNSKHVETQWSKDSIISQKKQIQLLKFKIFRVQLYKIHPSKESRHPTKKTHPNNLK
jgi:hypothetical protein